MELQAQTVAVLLVVDNVGNWIRAPRRGQEKKSQPSNGGMLRS